MDLVIQICNSDYFQTITKILLIFVLAGIIGLERDSWNKPAGFRTHALVGISAVLVVLCGEYFQKFYGSCDPTRIPAQLLSGIGFIGAGTILRDGANVKGLTTAASLLAVTCIGLCIGAGFYFIGIAATVISYIVLSYSYLLTDKLDYFNTSELKISFKGNKEATIKSIESVFDSKNIIIKKLHINEVNEIDEKESAEETEGSQNIIIDIKYDHNMKLSNIITSIGSLDDILKVEEI